MDEWFERSPVVGFAPWIIYWVVADGPSTWMFGAICAVVSALILGVSAGRGGPRLLEVVTIVFFVAVTIVGMVVGAEDRDWMDAHLRCVRYENAYLSACLLPNWRSGGKPSDVTNCWTDYAHGRSDLPDVAPGQVAPEAYFTVPPV